MKTAAAVLLLLPWALPCVAQQGVTSGLSGTVASAGQPLPGVKITLTASSLQGSRATITGINGGFLFALLPPADYLLHFELDGFNAVERNVPVGLAETARIQVDMRANPVTETMTVESDSQKFGQPLMATRFRAATLQSLPGPRDIRGAVLISPGGENLNNRLVIAGAPTWDSLFLVDGVVVNENLTGQPHNLLIEDAIEEIAILTGGIGAEYSRFTGGVISTVTKSGGNEFSGSVRDAVTNGAWTKRTPWLAAPPPLDKMNHAAEGTLGGFLVRNRLWFFTAVRRAANSDGRFTAFTNVPYPVGSNDTRWEGKLTDHVTDRQSIVVSYGYSSFKETNVVEVQNVLDLASIIAARSQLTTLGAVTYESIPLPNTFVETHYSQKRYALRGNGGLSMDPISGTYINVRGVGALLNAPPGCGICGDDRRDSNSWSGKASHYTNTRWGNHTLVTGAERFHEQRLNSGNRTASQFDIQTGSAQIDGASVYPDFNSATLIIFTPPFPGSHASNMNTWGAHVSDQWDTNRVSVNVGLRYDRNYARDAIGRRVSNDSAFSPRASATFDVRNDGRQHVVASYGRYTSKIFEGGGSSQQTGIFSQLGWRYLGPEINAPGTPAAQHLSAPAALARLFAWFESVGGIANRHYLSFFSDPVSSGQFVRSLQSPAVDAWSLGYSMELQHGSLRADYIRRNWRHFYAARVDTTTGKQMNSVGRYADVAWVVNDDSGTIRNYHGVQLQGSWRRGRTNLGGGYTWSKLWGNDEADSLTVSAPRNLPLQLWYPEFLAYPRRRPVGYLSADERHRARVWIEHDTPLRHGSIRASLLQWFNSGRPYSAEADIDATGRVTPYQGVPANPGYSLNQVTNAPYFFSARGAYRSDNVFSTDVTVNCELPLGPIGWFMKVDVLNVLDNAAVISPSAEVMTLFRNGPQTGLRAFNPFTEIPVEGVNYRLAPNFGKATGPESYQMPRTFEFIIGAHF